MSLQQKQHHNFSENLISRLLGHKTIMQIFYGMDCQVSFITKIV